MMPTLVDRMVSYLLIVVHLGLLAWALAGFAAMVLPGMQWPWLSNPLFSPMVLFLQWTVIGVAAVVFLAGYATRWRYLPHAMVVCYAAMAAVCAYETITLLVHNSRFLDMALEYATYLAIIAYLFLSPEFRRRTAPLQAIK